MAIKITYDEKTKQIIFKGIDRKSFLKNMVSENKKNARNKIQ